MNIELLKEIDIRDTMWGMALINGCKDPNEMENILHYFNTNRELLEQTARELRAKK